MIPDYSHLQTLAAESRYAMASHYLSKCSNIVEIGGDALHTYGSRAKSQQKFWNIDPSTQPNDSNSLVENHNCPVYEFDFSIIPRSNVNKNGLCLLGIEMFDLEYAVGTGTRSLEKIIEHVDLFDNVVLEFVTENLTASTQASILCKGFMHTLEFTKLVDINANWVPVGGPCNDSFSKSRTFWLLQRTHSPSSEMIRYVTIGKFAEMSGYSKDAINSKIKRGDWRQGEIWKKAPDGRRLIDIMEWKRWIKSQGSVR
jgi:hypothetical protein